MEDVERVASAPNTSLLFIFDERIYRSFSGEKTEGRGRRSFSNEWFTGAFPTLASVSAASPLKRASHLRGVLLELCSFINKSRPGVPRRCPWHPRSIQSLADGAHVGWTVFISSHLCVSVSAPPARHRAVALCRPHSQI